MTDHVDYSAVSSCYSNIVLKISLPSDHIFLNVTHLNNSSMLYKMDDIKRIVFNSNPKVIRVFETCLNSCDAHNSIKIPGFTCQRNDSDGSRVGGVLIYVKKRIEDKVISRSSNIGIEYIFIKFWM